MKNISHIAFYTLLSIIILSSCRKETLEPIGVKGSFTDSRDGKEYATVTFGNQTWMATNLDYKPENEDGSWYYQDDTLWKAYGRLYDWTTARKVCPVGWHLPTDGEWKSLEIYLGMDASEADSLEWRRSGAVGVALKTQGGWNDGGGGANRAQMNVLPAGFRETDGNYFFEGDLANFWSASYEGETMAWGRALIYFSAGVYRWTYKRESGFSVRCVKN